MTASMTELAAAAALLDRAQDFRVLRRMVADLEPRPTSVPPGALQGLYVDVETTDADPAACEIVQLAMARFAFSPDGDVYGVVGEYLSFNEPTRPISQDAIAVHGITLDDVKGSKIERLDVNASLIRTSLVIAHNASFDRPVLERLNPRFADVDWACSFRDVDWKARGHSCAKLEHLLAFHARQFYDAHDALQDCYAGLVVLARDDGYETPTAFGELLKNAQKGLRRLWATGAPFAIKDTLKQRGYRWSDGKDGARKAWHFDSLNAFDIHREVAWLQSVHAFPPGIVVEIPRHDLYSVRERNY